MLMANFMRVIFTIGLIMILGILAYNYLIQENMSPKGAVVEMVIMAVIQLELNGAGYVAQEEKNDGLKGLLNLVGDLVTKLILAGEEVIATKVTQSLLIVLMLKPILVAAAVEETIQSPQVEMVALV